MGKTKVLSNIEDERREGLDYIEISGHKVDILKLGESTKYLGRALSFESLHDTEIQHRINCGWSKFHVFKKGLCCKHYPLHDRLRLFEATVTPCVLYGCGTWTMTKDREHALRVAQRRMLRKIVQVGRRRKLDLEPSASDSESSDAGGATTQDDDLEDWVEWIKRATWAAEGAAKKARVTDWVEEQARRKFRWVGHVARRDDGRWNERLIHWCPNGSRRRGHPKRKWPDVLDAFFHHQVQATQGEWILYTGDRASWAALGDTFVKFSSKWIGQTEVFENIGF